MDKPKIQYSDLGRCLVGECASVFLRAHPHLIIKEGGEWVTTSRVQSLRPTANGPIFVTLNSIYLPLDAHFSDPPFTYSDKLPKLAEAIEA
jgi:hypothetical protein